MKPAEETKKKIDKENQLFLRNYNKSIQEAKPLNDIYINKSKRLTIDMMIFDKEISDELEDL